jgi:ABC-2 type transport system ATP-binding protein
MIEVNNLTKVYPSGKGVFNVSFKVEKGEVFGFLGPNGAGKTTTIRQLLGFTNATEGNCTINGLDTRENAHLIQRDLGYLPGEIAFFDKMNGHDFLNFISELRGKNSDIRKEELIRYFDLDLNHKIRKMSKGMKQKLGLIAAFMHDPDILILDEPTSGLDPIMQKKFTDLIKAEKERGKTILMSSHIFDEVEKVCSKAAIIKEGRIVVIEDIQKLKSNRQKSFIVNVNDEKDLNTILNSKINTKHLENNTVEIFISDNYNEMIQVLSSVNVIGFEETHQSLEQAFIHYYGKEGE